jgi:hypothetical protein
MTITKTITVMSLVFALIGTSLCQQSPRAASPELIYENHNQIDYGPLRIAKLSGIAKDLQGTPVPDVLVLLFSEKEHTLIAQSKSDSKGAFGLEGIRGGRYRLVLKYDGFCSANVPVDLKLTSRRKRSLVVHMRPAGIDECSYGELQ